MIPIYNTIILSILIILISPLLGISQQSVQLGKTPMSAQEQDILKLEQQIKHIRSEIQRLNQNKPEQNNIQQFKTYSSEITDFASKDTVNIADIMTNIDSDNSIIDLKNKPLGGIFDHKGGIDVGGAPAITTMGEVTYLGSYSGNNSIPIGMISGSLFASTLLGQRDKFDDYSIFFGGRIEADAQVWFGSSNISNASTTLSNNGQNIYLTAATLYFVSNLGHYVTTQFDFNTTELNNFSLGNAFVIFGNLDTSPFFLTVGRNSLSVGAFGGGGTWTGGMTKFLAPGRVTNISLNYKNDILNANIAVFGAKDNQVNFSSGLFYAQQWNENLAVGFNTGYVYNLANADNSSLSQFLANYSSTNDTIGSFDINGNITYSIAGGLLNIGAGWATTTNKNKFNGTNKDVLAGGWYSAANYSAVIKGRNTNFGISYGQTYNGSKIPMALSASPLSFGRASTGVKQQFIVSSQRAYFDNNVLFGPEYSYQRLYNNKHMHAVTLDMSVYI